MKTIIAGGRDYMFTKYDHDVLDHLDITEVVCGCATGADECGRIWAERKGIPVKRFPADWKTHGKPAGPIRNREMAGYADAVVLFPGGHGTASMKFEAREAGLLIIEVPNKSWDVRELGWEGT